MNTAMHGASRLIVRGTIVLTLGLLSVLAISATSASAHTELVSSIPADGAVLQAAPVSVTFEFDEPLLPDLDTVSINNEQGANVYSQKVAPVDSSLTIAWPATLPDGTYQVAYRVVSDDGHPVTGAISFTIAAAETSPPATAVPLEPATDDSGSNLLIRLLALGALAASIAVIYVLVKRRR